MSAQVGSVPSRWLFTGQEQEERGLVYMQARYYDPTTGQFISLPPSNNQSRCTQKPPHRLPCVGVVL